MLSICRSWREVPRHSSFSRPWPKYGVKVINAWFWYTDLSCLTGGSFSEEFENWSLIGKPEPVRLTSCPTDRVVVMFGREPLSTFRTYLLRKFYMWQKRERSDKGPCCISSGSICVWNFNVSFVFLHVPTKPIGYFRFGYLISNSQSHTWPGLDSKVKFWQDEARYALDKW